MAESRNTSPRDWPVELQDGVLTRSQALAVGITDKIIAAHVKRGRWQRLQRGVYATFSGTVAGQCAWVLTVAVSRCLETVPVWPAGAVPG